MSGKIMMVSDDGKVYQVNPKQLGKLAKRVPLSKLSPAIQTHIEKTAKDLTGGKGVAHILATKSDILTAGQVGYPGCREAGHARFGEVRYPDLGQTGKRQS